MGYFPFSFIGTRAIIDRLDSLEESVSELSSAIADLQASVASLAARVSAGIGPLQDALDAANQALEDFQAEDTVEDAAYEERIAALTADLQARVEEANAATEAIRGTVDTLEALGRGEAVEEPPAEEPPTPQQLPS